LYALKRIGNTFYTTVTLKDARNNLRTYENSYNLREMHIYTKNI